MSVAAITIGVLACAFIVVIGLRFLLSPAAAAIGYGIPPDSVRGLTAIKGVRDIASGVVLLTVWAAAGSTAFGWSLLAAALIPLGDAVIVRATGGRLATALGVHGLTALLLVVAGAVLVLA